MRTQGAGGEIVNKIKEWREARGMTQLELAQQMGVAVTVLSALGQMESDPARR